MTLRILLINPIGRIGGAERCLLTMIGAIRATEPAIEIHGLACGEGPLVEEMRRAGAIAHCLPLPAALAGLGESGWSGQGRWRAMGGMAARAIGGWTDGRDYPRRLRALIEEIAPNVIHSNGMKTHLLTGGLGRWACPVLWHMHDLPGERRLAPWLLRMVSDPVSGAIAISRAVAADLARVLPRLPVEIILNAVDTDCFTPGPADGAWLDRLARLRPADGDMVRVGLIATYARWKGQDVFLETAAQVLKRVNSGRVRFYIVGGPVYETRRSQFSREELESRVDLHGIGEQVGFIPFQQSTVEINRALDVVVHASTRPEPFGLTIAEAMSCGRAVIVSAAGGAVELFTPGDDGLAVRPGRADDMARAILELVNDADLRRRLGAQARRTAVEKFNPRRYGRQLCDFYHRCAESARGGSAGYR